MNHAICTKKRKHGDRIYSFKNFCSQGHPVHFEGSFHENVRELLEFGDRDGGARRWSFQLELHRHPPVCVTLYVMEEIVENSQHRSCQHCKFIGWGHHMICNKRYHFVLPSKKGILQKEEELSDYIGGKSKLMKLQGQLMHGVIHLNGFGHLLCVNGIAGGSEIITGQQIVDFWDRICSGLHLRKVSLTDTARKGAMSLRLIHGVAYGEPWFATWGYHFGRGGHGVTQHMYHSSIEALQSLPLCHLVSYYGSYRREVPTVVAKYQAISCNSLHTLGHLFRFMLQLKRRLPPDNVMSAVDYHGITNEPACRWSTKRVEMAAQVIVDALKKAGNRWVPRQDVRDASRLYIGDTGLLDFVLKSIGNHIVGTQMVRRMVNPVTKVLEYSLEDMSHSLPDLQEQHHRPRPPHLLTRLQLTKDMHVLYNHVLKDQSVTNGPFGAIPLTAVRVVLDSKLLLKDYTTGRDQTMHGIGNNTSILVPCCLRLRNTIYEHELIKLPAYATIADLKRKAEEHFREIYLGLRGLVVESLVDMEGDDDDLVVGRLEEGRGVVVCGRAEGEEVMCEGSGSGVVDCVCGAKMEDGERMVCCDVCEVWQHSRCLKIPNGEEVPRVFLCRYCEEDIVSLPSLLV